MPKVLIAGIDSEIGKSVALDFFKSGWEVLGTSRRNKSKDGFQIFDCDFSKRASIKSCIESISNSVSSIDILVIAAGTLRPVGDFFETNFDEWERCFQINFLGPFEFINGIVGSADVKLTVVFAGGGINSAPLNYSSYTLSKVALTKGIELLAAENPGSKFVSLGTGWIKSPIHEQTLEAGVRAGSNLGETERRISTGNFGDIKDVTRFIIWAMNAPSAAVSGRNFSLQNDNWGSGELTDQLVSNQNLYKLRRNGN